MSSLPIPTTQDDLSPVWLTSALRSGGVILEDEVSAVEVENIGAGVGLMAGLYRCSITYTSNEGEGPKSVVIKIRSDDPKSLKVARTFQLYQKEVVFYQETAPLTPMAVPQLYYSDFNAKNNDFVLVIEDLKSMVSTSQVVGATEEQGRLAIRHAAKMHAKFWNRDQIPPMRGYFSQLAPSYVIKIHIGFHKSVPRVLEHLGDDLSPTSKALIQAFGDNLASHYRDMARGPRTLTHGDYRLDNMFFGPPGENELLVIDWQTHGIGIGLADVAYFMSGSLEPGVRRTIERDGLAEYHEITCREGNVQWSLEECWRSYRQNFVIAMTVPIIAAGELSLDDENAFELVQTGIRRMNVALEELDVAEFMPQQKSVFSVSGIQSALGRQLSRLVD